MSLFTDWNSILLQEYFSPAKAGQNVWVSSTKLELEGIGIHRGGASGLIEAVRQGPAWLYSNENLANKAVELTKQRKCLGRRPVDYCDPGDELGVYKRLRAPTYLPYLAIWVFAKSEAGGTGFYDKVSELIREPFPNNTRKQMEYVWADLAHWSKVQLNGRLGNFSLNVLGQHRFVGMARAQAMVTNKDVDGISRLFGSCRLQPGQDLDDNQFVQLLEHGGCSNYLSLGLKDAMVDETYSDHLRQLLTMYLEFWDGHVPKAPRVNGHASNEQGIAQRTVDDEVTIILQMKDNGWDIGWRLPATITGLNYRIKVGSGEEAKAKLELTGTHVHSIASVSQNNARNALNKSAVEEVEAILSYTESNGESNERRFFLRQDKVRVLVFDSPDPSLHDSLLEREMPVAGKAYLFYSHREYSNLEQCLTNEKIEYELVDAEGLPDLWGLIYIADTSNITSEQRALILDEEPAALTKARIRFVGGKPIIGSGSKKYAYYDLPIVELEAPDGTEIASDGVSFEELNDAENVLVRRFKFSLEESIGGVFKINAKLGGEVLCTAGFSVLAVGGLAVTQRTHFSINKYGMALSDDSGLSGAIIGDGRASCLDVSFFHMTEKMLSNWNEVRNLGRMEFDVSSLFMDSVATTVRGSMTYGVARDQIRRLSNNMGIDNVEPGLLIRELRRRGHVEIETDDQGHMVRICAVTPTLYSLPIKDGFHNKVYAVCGSLRIQQWKELAEASDCRVFVDQTSSYYSSVVRVIPKNLSAVSAVAKVANFQVVDTPSQKISQWLGSIEEVKESLSWYESYGLSPNYLERLNPQKGVFNGAKDIMVDKDRKVELFRYEDLRIQGLRVYRLGNNLGDGKSKYSFIQDSRWGVWMAMGAFAEWVKKAHGITDASPWPFHYDSVTACLWLPARIEPPFVIERALTLCAGDGPKVFQVSGEFEGDSILLSSKEYGMIGKVSLVYSEMANGKWLCYRWVPEEVARNVANLLGGELKYI